MRSVRQVGPLDRSFGWAGGAVLDGSEVAFGPPPEGLRGSYAALRPTSRGVRLVRDPLGVNKLFWAMNGDTILVAARPYFLVEAGCSFEAIRALPPGVVIDVDLENRTVRSKRLSAPDRDETVTESVEQIAQQIGCTLRRYLAALAAALPDASVYVCVSGGLDSAGIALLAREVFADVTAVSFDLNRRDGRPSADRQSAKQLAAHLGLPFLGVTSDPEVVLEGLDVALRDGIDWRDFNVHAALVNVALARGIRAHVSTRGAPHTLVLTGDCVNEYLCDYHVEEYRGRTYYALPRVETSMLQRALVRGLETSHREVGPFQACGLPVVQPYAVAVDPYLALPASFFSDPARKERLCRLLFGGALPEDTYTRPKSRAQVGDEQNGRGVLALCIDNGIDAPWLRRRFAELHGVGEEAALDGFMRGGRYRWLVPY